MNKSELVIFDCDGVLVDSERISNTVFYSMLNELGLSLNLDDMFEKFVGNSTSQCIEVITGLLGRTPPEDFMPTLRIRAEAALRSSLTMIAGVDKVLQEINIPFCVASNGEHEKMKLTLGSTGLLKHFEGRMFSATDVKNPKPAPDVYLHAARILGVHPEACAVIEDTPTGVRAGVAAGMRVFGYSANTPAHRLQAAGAHQVFSDMQTLPELLRSAGRLLS